MRLGRHLVSGVVAGAVGTAAIDLELYRRYRRDGGKDPLWRWEFASGVIRWDEASAPGQFGHKVLRLVNGVRVAPKLREEEVDTVLAGRPELGQRLDALPAVTWTATCAYDVNRVADPYVQSRLTVPEMVLRRYDAPTC